MMMVTHRQIAAINLLAGLMTLASMINSTAGRQDMIDLSHQIDKDSLYWITARPYELKIIVNGTTRVGDVDTWVQQDEFYMSGHTATHLDAPCHYARGRWSPADIPLDNMIDRPLAIVDVSQKCMNNRDYEASVDDVKDWESKNGKIPDRSVLIIQTGWARFWPRRLEYFGTDTRDPNLAHFPGVSGSLAQWLVDNRNIVGLGIDGPSVDHGPTRTKSAHRIFAEKNIFNLENMANSVSQLPPTGYNMMVLPMKLKGASAVPVTVVAYRTSGAKMLSSGAPVVMSLGWLLVTIVGMRF